MCGKLLSSWCQVLASMSITTQDVAGCVTSRKLNMCPQESANNRPQQLSFTHTGARLFNVVPPSVRNLNSSNTQCLQVPPGQVAGYSARSATNTKLSQWQQKTVSQDTRGEELLGSSGGPPRLCLQVTRFNKVNSYLFIVLPSIRQVEKYNSNEDLKYVPFSPNRFLFWSL